MDGLMRGIGQKEYNNGEFGEFCGNLSGVMDWGMEWKGMGWVG